MTKTSLHKRVDHCLDTLTVSCNWALHSPPVLNDSVTIFCVCAYIFCVDYIFMWFIEKDILEIFDTHGQMTCYKGSINLHPFQ